ncbi:phage portal protein [Staphylococcus simulans]|uniref:phage portal protein n=1 Tax=Staphylococcus simulans TaxID=1286 RepID=UPI001E62BB1D|nr:phage portal protein [Staphylococcus simulans]MCD8914262.1 phage portal protein [Staphylococcus simulans]
MGIFFEKRSVLPEDSTLTQADLSVFPFNTIPLSSLEWNEFEALKNSDIWTAVTLLSRDIAKLDIKVMKNGVVNDKDRLEILLNKVPNRYYNGYVLKYITMMNALLTNHGYIKIERNPQGGIYELYHVKTSNCRLAQDKRTGEYYYEVSNGGDIMKVPYQDILDIKPFSTDGLTGLSVLEALRDDINNQVFSKRFFTNFFTNGAQAGSVLKMKDGKLSEEARERVKEKWQKANSGDTQAGKVIVLDSTMEYEQLEISTDILKAINENTSSTKSIAKAFQIPLSKFGIEMSNTSLKDINNDYLMNCLGGYMKMWTAELDFKLINTKDIYNKEFQFDTSSFRKIDWGSYVETLNSQLDKGGLTHDEYRKELGLPPLPNNLGKIPRVDLNHISMDIADDFQLAKKSNNNNMKGGEV